MTGLSVDRLDRVQRRLQTTSVAVLFINVQQYPPTDFFTLDLWSCVSDWCGPLNPCLSLVQPQHQHHKDAPLHPILEQYDSQLCNNNPSSNGWMVLKQCSSSVCLNLPSLSNHMNPPSYSVTMHSSALLYTPGILLPATVFWGYWLCWPGPG